MSNSERINEDQRQFFKKNRGGEGDELNFSSILVVASYLLSVRSSQKKKF